MREATIIKSLVCFPCTQKEMSIQLELSEIRAYQIITGLVKLGYVEKWGSKLGPSGNLVSNYQLTEKGMNFNKA